MLAALSWPWTGCAGAGRVFAPPRVSLTGIELQRLSLASADLLLDFEVDNPNRLALVLDSIDYRLSVNGEPLLAGRQDERIEIAARTRGSAQLPVSIGIPDLVRVVRSVRRNERPHYDLAGELRFAAPVVGTRTVQIRRQGEVSREWLGQLGFKEEGNR
jgi:LEA14-like dessication related protein